MRKRDGGRFDGSEECQMASDNWKDLRRAVFCPRFGVARGKWYIARRSGSDIFRKYNCNFKLSGPKRAITPFPGRIPYCSNYQIPPTGRMLYAVGQPLRLLEHCSEPQTAESGSSTRHSMRCKVFS